MSKGKQASTSQSAYKDEINQCINNRIFKSQEEQIPEEKKDCHTKNFFTRHFTNTQNKISVTRNPLSVSDEESREKFLTMVLHFEAENNLRLSEISKAELFYLFMDYIEDTNSIIHLKDDAQQFLVYRFLFPDIMQVYLYKLFYPRIFEFDIICAKRGKTVKFKSKYIEEHFNQIFKQIKMLCFAIVYDAMIIAVERCAVNHISSMKNYSVELTPSDSVNSMIDDYSLQLENISDVRTPLVEKFCPSLIFFAKHHGYLYKTRTLPPKKVSAIIKFDAYYTGKRSDSSRKALISAYEGCASVLKSINAPFTKLLNIYHINKNSSLYDLNILKDNIQFMPYAMDGILTKHHISHMMSDNNEKLKKGVDTSLNLSSVYNNPNCIISNISMRDYEMLDYIISHTAKTCESYYLTTIEQKEVDEKSETDKTDKKKSKVEKDIKTSLVCDIIDIVDKSNFTNTVAKIIPDFSELITNKNDYDMVIDWIKPFKADDEEID